MSSIGSHILRRSWPMQETQGCTETDLMAAQRFKFTTIACCIVLVLIEYTYGTLIPTIASVETPSAMFVGSEKLDEDSSKEPLVEREQKPVSTSVRATIRHLRSVGGCLSRFRGAAIYILHNLFVSRVAAFLYLFSPFYDIAFVAAFTLATPLRTLWIHTIISAPPSTTWWRRLKSIKYAKAVGATAMVAVMDRIAYRISYHIIYMPVNSFLLFPDVDNDASQLGMTDTICFATIYAVFMLVVAVPSTAILNRVQASLLGDSEDAIVSVDHGEPLGIGQVLERFDLDALRRMYRAYALNVLIQAVVFIFFVALELGELGLLCGPGILKQAIHGAAAEFMEYMYNSFA